MCLLQINWLLKLQKRFNQVVSDSFFSSIVRLSLMRLILRHSVMHGSNITLHIPCFSPNVHLRHNRLCFMNTSIYLSCCTSVYSVSLCVRFRWESAQEQKTDDFRCFITVWSIGIARRGLNELVFVKTSNSTNLVFFLPLAQNEPVHVHTHSARHYSYISS